jgi:CheY-like chemotaxis protein
LRFSRSLRILIVEDEILIALELESLLQDAGHDVVAIAASSQDAIALGQRMRPDLAFVDIHLTDGPTGAEAARRLREQGAAVLFMTANAKRIRRIVPARAASSESPTPRGLCTRRWPTSWEEATPCRAGAA